MRAAGSLFSSGRTLRVARFKHRAHDAVDADFLLANPDFEELALKLTPRQTQGLTIHNHLHVDALAVGALEQRIPGRAPRPARGGLAAEIEHLSRLEHAARGVPDHVVGPHAEHGRDGRRRVEAGRGLGEKRV